MKPLALAAILLTFLIGLALHVDPTTAQVYKKRNADGTVTYTDQPVQGAEKVEVEAAPVTEFAKLTVATPTEQPQALQAQSGPASADAVPTEFSVTITSPEYQAPIRANNGQFDVLWQSEPERLPEGYQYELFVDGVKSWTGADSNQATLMDVARGERRIHLQIVDANGQAVARSDTLVVYVLRVAISGAGQSGGGA
ncbi:hypothetical protein CWI82_09545 [Pseudidiomarina tainanensis]|uniref:Uncharacterized protein n=1 Tax=Pseudidiomarina tainanensis TaxID=502365 RepID=A0ACD2HG71_9GAMM|nr:DUF4124 domain-containing protein [Pseudidiomarina tainanensis]RZQ55613.1 hypothetical protein CWI82_09545 [Pseudidiomarina tainanensis]